MSGYDYVTRTDYVDYSGKPGYDIGRGTRTYVTTIEERVEQVRRPSTKGYVYSSAMKAGKEGRPREVDDFVTKILDEVNGLSVSTTRQVNPTNDYGDGYFVTKGDGGTGYYYEVEYIYAGSPVESRISRKFGDPFDKQGASSQVYDYPSQRDYGIPNKPLDNSRQRFGYEVGSPVKPQISGKYEDPFDKRGLPSQVYSQRDYGVPNKPLDNSRQTFEVPREYEVPKNQRERSSYPNYDASPYNPPSVRSHASKSYEAKPESPRDNGVSYNQWDKQSSPVYDRAPQREYGVPNNQWINSSAKLQSPKAYEGPGDEWNRPSNPYPNYDEPQSNSRWGNSPSKPQNSKGYGDPDNQWGKSLKPIRTSEQKTAGRPLDIQQGTSPVKPFYGGGNGILDNQKGRSLSPEYEHPPRNEIGGGVPKNEWANSPKKPQSPMTFQDSDNQGGISSSPIYDLGGASKKWGNSPLKPAYDQPPSSNNNGGVPNRLQRYSAMKPQSPNDSEFPGNQKGMSATPPDYEQVPANDNRWDNSPLKTQSPRVHGARDTNWGRPSSPVLGQSPRKPEQANVPNANGSPTDQNGRSAVPEYEHPPRYAINASPLKAQSDQDNKDRNNRVSAGDMNTPLKTESPRDHGARGIQWSKPSSDVKNKAADYDNKANVTNNKYSQPNKQAGRSYGSAW